MNVITESFFEDIKMWKMGSNAFGRPQMYVYSYLINGLLIDTGQPRVKKDFVERLKPETIDRIVLTHHHEDHSGNVEAIKKAKRINAYASPLCCEYMLSPKRVEPARWMTWGQHTKANLIPFENSIINTEQYKFEIIHTPGHAADQISLYEANKGWLFSGDIYINDYIKIYMRDEVMLDQIQSLEKLIALDFDVLLCNHQPTFSNGKDKLISKLQFLNTYYGNVKAEYKQGKNLKEIMEAMNLKDNRFQKVLTFGQLSQKNMVLSALKTIKEDRE